MTRGRGGCCWAPRLLVLAALLAVPARAADISFDGIRNDGPKEVRFRLRGEIAQGDVQRLDAALVSSGVSYSQDPWRRIVVSLDSPGGSYHEGLDLALAFRKRGLATVVRSGDQCMSACAIAFLGGTALPKDPEPARDQDPLPDQLPDRSLEPGGRHREPCAVSRACRGTAMSLSSRMLIGRPCLRYRG